MQKELRRRLASITLVAGAGLLLACSGPSDNAPHSGNVTELPSTSIQVVTEPATTEPATPPSITSAPTTAPATSLPTPGRTGVFVTAGGDSAIIGSGPVKKYSVAVEESLGLDPADIADVVDRTLSDPRSWIADGSVGFERVADDADIEIIVASPATVDSRCLPLRTIGLYSCRSGNSVNINSDRWFAATSDWTLGIDAYRGYVINHEVGHALGHGHQNCGGHGLLAPVMMQQTKGLDGCVGNPWPFPDPNRSTD